ncbi:MAG TPA: 16S rRNA (cytosine(967)-C(5))-methyltransferase RsmB, partial [Atribacterota bacterium]|nr:16S rRNA (cytosine(967)-C(5))-methyltransferase RsmB [Atribacterota bacterium]
CSGTGVIRKKPDIKWKQWNLNHLSELNKVQSALLDTATHYLKPGGEILYTTCSMEKEENEDIIRIFLKKNTNFVIQESLPFSRKRGIVSYNTGIKEAIQLIPGYSGPDIDGFYMLKMRKKK